MEDAHGHNAAVNIMHLIQVREPESTRVWISERLGMVAGHLVPDVQGLSPMSGDHHTVFRHLKTLQRFLWTGKINKRPQGHMMSDPQTYPRCLETVPGSQETV